jgi:glycosyltransferase involved in cell wall biosynthesis
MLRSQISFYAVVAGDEVATRLERNGVVVYRVPLASHSPRLLRFSLGLLVTAWVMLRHEIDFIHNNSYGESLLLVLLPSRKLRLFLTSHHMPPKPRLATIYRHVFSALNGICCVSNATARDVNAFLGGMRNVIVVENWIPTQMLRPIAPVVHEGPVKVLFVGRLEKFKGAHLAIEAVREIPEAELIVVGGGPYKSELLRMALGCSNIRLVGFASDAELEELSSSCAICVNPSMGPEGSSLVLLESMARGLACVASDLPVFRELLESSDAVLMFPSGDAKSLADRIRFLIHHPDARKELVSNAYRLVDERYGERTAYIKYLEFFGVQPRMQLSEGA